MPQKLDERTVKALGPKLSDDGRPLNVTYWDEDERGFGLQVTRAGRKSWVLKFIWGRRQDWHVFGHYPGLTVQAARTRARELKDGIGKGINPREDQRERREAQTVNELATKALDEHWKVKGKARSIEEVESLLKQWILPKLGKHLVKDVTDADVARLLHAMRETPIRANRALSCLSKLFALAEKWGERSKGSNPAKGQERNPETKRKRYLQPEEVLWFAAGLRSQQTRYPVAVSAIRLLLFTGMRSGEVLAMKWSWVDQKNGIIRIPPEAHKTGKKTGEKLIPLNSEAIAIIKGVTKRGRLGPYVFQSPGKTTPIQSLQDAWNDVLTAGREAEAKDAKQHRRKPRTGLLAGLRIHDLRHSFASYVVSGGTSLPMTGALLGHSQASTTQRYAHLLSDPLRVASQTAGDALLKLMEGGA
jgi:integrase